MSYLVFARKYRPQAFDDVVGQAHITTTLKNAILSGRVAHAYLFAGPRGIGKTTTARILAKAINCEKASAAEPCNKCESCVEITRGSSLDILEIDGASNRGIDEIRNLRENVKFSPSRGRFKVYIIDEVHMLTSEAFNALLKTLEEPPAHVKFIFATTQPHKVPPTVLSRCQRFDFRRIPAQKIVSSLKDIAKKEKITVSDGALELIAKHSDGSMRDAEAVLDQAASFGKGRIDAEDIVDMLGSVSEESLFALTDSIVSRKADAALGIAGDLIDAGRDPCQILANLIEHFRNLIVVKAAPDAKDLVDSSPEKLARLKEASNAFSQEELLYCAYSMVNASELARRTNLTRIPLEVALVKLCGRADMASLDEILKKVKELEGAIGLPPKAFPRTPKTVAVKEEAKAPDKPAAPEPAREAGGASIEEITRSWQNILNHIKAKKISIASYLLEGSPRALEGDILTISFSPEFKFHKEVLEENGENRGIVEEAVAASLGTSYRVKFTLLEEAPAPADGARDSSGGASTGSQRLASMDRPSRKVDPIVKDAMDIFDGGLVAREKFSPKDKLS